ncbi:MAG: glycosyltransferase family 87 protein [Planctomycetota bacterium]
MIRAVMGEACLTTPPGPTAVGTSASHDVHSRWETWAWRGWILLAIGIAARIALFERDPGRNNVYLTVFAVAADAFRQGGDLYLEPDGWASGFRYLPLSAAMLVPFSLCGAVLGSVLWRLLAFGMLAAALRLATRLGFPFPLSSRQRAFVLIVVGALGIGSLNNGQSNPHILACFLLATLGSLRGHAAGPAAAVAGSVALKVYPVAYGGVLGALRLRHAAWLAVFVAAVFALPFALQDPAYVARQYTDLWNVLRGEDRTGGSLIHAYRDLRLVAVSFGLTMPDPLFLVLGALSGGAIVVACLLLRRAGGSEVRVHEYAFSLTMCWFLLLGPATEKSTYTLLGPPLAWTWLAAKRSQSRGLRALVVLAMVLAFLGLTSLDRPRDERPVWVWCFLPYSALAASAALVWRITGDFRALRAKLTGQPQADRK